MNPKTTDYLNNYGPYGLGMAKDNAGKGESKYLDRHNKKKIQEQLSVRTITATPSKRTPVKRDLSVSAKSGKTPKDYFRNKNVEEITNYEQETQRDHSDETGQRAGYHGTNPNQYQGNDMLKFDAGNYSDLKYKNTKDFYRTTYNPVQTRAYGATKSPNPKELHYGKDPNVMTKDRAELRRSKN